MKKVIATFFYVGLMPFAPGTWGSLAALPFAVALHYLGGFPVLLTAILVTYYFGYHATNSYTRDHQDHDPKEVVIDEVVGQWIALLPLSGALSFMGASISFLPWPGLLAAFLAFRLFDIAKPWPVSWADRKKTATGVMLDDVIAGVLAGIVVTILGSFFHGFLL